MDSLQQRLQSVRGKVMRLVETNRLMAKELEVLKAENEQLKQTAELQKNALAELKDQNKMIKLAKEMSGGSDDHKALKMKINDLVRDIDKCIDLLNE